jgi:hypothetical protein
MSKAFKPLQLLSGVAFFLCPCPKYNNRKKARNSAGSLLFRKRITYRTQMPRQICRHQSLHRATRAS